MLKLSQGASATHDRASAGFGKGLVDAQGLPSRQPHVDSNPAREAYWRARLNESPWKRSALCASIPNGQPMPSTSARIMCTQSSGRR